MPEMIKPFLRRLPFVYKVLFMTVFAGILVSYITDSYNHSMVEKMFRLHLQNMLDTQSQEDRLRFDHYLKDFHQVARLTAEHRPFLEYVKKSNWSTTPDELQMFKGRLPGWLLNRQALGHLAVPHYVILIDRQENVREIFSRNPETDLPKILLNPPALMIEKGRGQTHIFSDDDIPYAFTAEDISLEGFRKATLILVSPLNDEFLMATQKDMPHRLIGLVDVEKETLIASNNNYLLPRKISLEKLKEGFVITGRDYHDYGSAEVAIRLSSFVPKDEITTMSHSIISSARKGRLVTSGVYFFVFILITLWITMRIKILTKKVDRFSRRALGGDSPEPLSGDQLDILSERFQMLTEEVTSAQNMIKQKSKEEAEKQIEYETNSRQLIVLELIMESLGFGVLIKQGEEFQPANSIMFNYLKTCAEVSGFIVNPEEIITREISCSEGNKYIFQLTGLELLENSQVIVVNDITEQITMAAETEKLQQDLHQAMKMESIGRLAGGIAHDFNNIMTAVLGYAQLGIIKTEESDPLKSNFTNIFEAAKRASDMTQQLLSFSRKQKIRPQIIDLKIILEGLKKMFGRLIGENIEVEVCSEKELWKTQADRTQIEQVLMNLALNARDAMPEGGRLIFSTSNADLMSSPPQKHQGISPGKYVKLVVTDFGNGMTNEDMEHIFEPFYTTKAIGKGTGLGLATVYGIVKQNKGYIFVHSEPGKGSTFSLYLPAIEGVVKDLDKEVTKEDLAPGTETILLVEDEERVRKLIKGVLSSLGYKILEADSATLAEEIFTKYQDDIDLLFTDIIMPGITGVKLARRISKKKPDLKILFMTGYRDNDIIQDLDLGSGANLLHKPLTPISIAQKVREVLDIEQGKIPRDNK